MNPFFELAEKPAQEKQNTVHFLLTQIAEQGVKHCFFVPGKMIEPFMRAFSSTAITPIVTAHETGAGFMADGYARASSHFGFCLSIAGPGAMNLIPAFAAAKADNIPILGIGGGILEALAGLGAFQDNSATGIDELPLFKAVTKFATRISTAKHTEAYVKQALRSMLANEKGPVYLSIPLNTQIEKEDFNAFRSPFVNMANFISLDHFNLFKEALLNPMSNTVFLLGSRANTSQVSLVLQQLAECFHIPVATTLCAKGAFPEDHLLSLGVFGFGGSALANETLLGGRVDNIIALGVDFNQRNSLVWSKKLKANQQFIQIDPVMERLYHFDKIDHAIHSDCGRLLQLLLNQLKTTLGTVDLKPREQWLIELKKYPKYDDLEKIYKTQHPIHPARVMLELRKAAPRETILCVDSGIHRIFAAHYWTSYQPQQYLTSVNQAPMGWAIAAGIGAKLAKPENPCIVVTGDGCMLMHGNEIQTASRYHIPVIFVVLNNHAHGGIHIDAVKAQKFPKALTALPVHSFALYAHALGLSAFTVKDVNDLYSTFCKALALNKPCLIDVHCGAEYTAPNDCYEREYKEHYHAN